MDSRVQLTQHNFHCHPAANARNVTQRPQQATLLQRQPCTSHMACGLNWQLHAPHLMCALASWLAPPALGPHCPADWSCRAPCIHQSRAHAAHPPRGHSLQSAEQSQMQFSVPALYTCCMIGRMSQTNGGNSTNECQPCGAVTCHCYCCSGTVLQLHMSGADWHVLLKVHQLQEPMSAILSTCHPMAAVASTEPSDLPLLKVDRLPFMGWIGDTSRNARRSTGLAVPYGAVAWPLPCLLSSFAPLLLPVAPPEVGSSLLAPLLLWMGLPRLLPALFGVASGLLSSPSASSCCSKALMAPTSRRLHAEQVHQSLRGRGMLCSDAEGVICRKDVQHITQHRAPA